MEVERVVVTGGTGHIGQAVVHHLSQQGYEVINVDRSKPSNPSSEEFVRADLTDPGEVYGTLAKTLPDAIVHLGTVSTPKSDPGYVTFLSNLGSSSYLLEASSALDVSAVCLPSSISVIGAGFQSVPMEVAYLPVDEAHPLTPRDPYGLAKQAMEVVADGFGRQRGNPRTISSIRFPLVAREAELRDWFKTSDRTLDVASSVRFGGRDELFTYVHIDDAVSIVQRAIEATFEGHERFAVSAADTTVEDSTEHVVAEAYPDAEVRDSFEEHDSLITTEKASRMLGWSPTRTWRDL